MRERAKRSERRSDYDLPDFRLTLARFFVAAFFFAAASAVVVFFEDFGDGFTDLDDALVFETLDDGRSALDVTFS